MHIIAATATELFDQVAGRVLRDGVEASPRGLPTREVLAAQLTLTDPCRRLVDAAGRRINPAFAAAEFCWILSGSDEPWIFDFNSRLRQYADSGVLRGAYGPRIRAWGGAVDQLDRARCLLLSDAHSRQATVQIFDPGRDALPNRDIPCTLNYRFYLRGDRLHMFTTMRSQDVWLGLPYDLFTATAIQEVLAGLLQVGVGRYVHAVDSLHLYEPDWERAGGVTARGDQDDLQDPLGSLAVPWEELDTTLTSTIAGRPVGRPGWDDLARVLRSYRLWRGGEKDAAIAAVHGDVRPMVELTRR